MEFSHGQTIPFDLVVVLPLFALRVCTTVVRFSPVHTSNDVWRVGTLSSLAVPPQLSDRVGTGGAARCNFSSLEPSSDINCRSSFSKESPAVDRQFGRKTTIF